MGLDQEPYQVRLEIFEGPMDLLLYLIRKNEIDIYDIPINLIVEQYQHYLELMKSLNLEVAGEFLVMASTLSHIKSRMLLPRSEEEEQEEDPRRELVEKLLEYQRYKFLAQALAEREQVGREVFVRSFDQASLQELAEEKKAERIEFAEVDIFQLLDAFQELLKRRKVEDIRRVVSERVRVVDKISQILNLLKAQEEIEFEQLFSDSLTRSELVATFLALLELIRLQVVRAVQSHNFAPILIRRAVSLEDEKLSFEYLNGLIPQEEKGGEDKDSLNH